MKKRFFIPIFIIILIILYPYFVNVVASTDFSAIKENKRIRGIAKEFDFERFVRYVEENRIADFNRSVLLDYMEKNNIKLKEEDVDYLFNLISNVVIEGGRLSGFSTNVGVSDSVKVSVSHTYFGFMTLSVYPNYLRTMHRIFFYFVYFLIGLFVFLCIFTFEKN